MFGLNKFVKKSGQDGFTMFELVVVLIGFAIVIALLPWAYSSFVATPEQVLPASVKQKLIDISLLKSDISVAVTQIEEFKNKNGYYPTTNNCLAVEDEKNICLEPSQGSVFDYKPEISKETVISYELYGSKKGVAKTYFVTNENTTPTVAQQTDAQQKE